MSCYDVISMFVMGMMSRSCAYLVFTVDGITAAAAAAAAAAGTVAVADTAGSSRAIVAPAGTPLSVGTITGHVTSVTADTADNVGRVILLLGAVVLAMTNLTTILASLVFVVTERSVQSSKLTQLVALELVLTFGDRGSLVNRV